MGFSTRKKEAKGKNAKTRPQVDSNPCSTGPLTTGWPILFRSDYLPPPGDRLKKRAMAKNGSSRSFLGQKRVGRIMKAANNQFGLT